MRLKSSRWKVLGLGHLGPSATSADMTGAGGGLQAWGSLVLLVSSPGPWVRGEGMLGSQNAGPAGGGADSSLENRLPDWGRFQGRLTHPWSLKILPCLLWR